ncbi:hypothetical protein FHG87_002365 [Trinorchestia longiramus]|nr:hypothetical protein FHG87_002365 [Trinorchestia longiramus]
MVALLAVVDATANFNHRRLDDSGHTSMDAKSPDVQKHLGSSSSRTTALVEEVFGPDAVVEADESRRIYAISIPSIYPDEGPPSGRRSGYQPPVYRPRNRPVGQNEEIYPHFEEAQSPASSHAFPQHYRKSGLRLIVSGPAETEIPIASSAVRPSFEYSRGRQQSDLPDSRFENRRPSVRREELTARDFEGFTRHLDHRGNVPPPGSIAGDENYSSVISGPKHSGVKVGPLNDYDLRSLSNGGYNTGPDHPYSNLRHGEESTFFSGDELSGFRDYNDGSDYFGVSDPHQDNHDVREESHGKLPSGFVLHGEPALKKLPLPYSSREHPQGLRRPEQSRDVSQDESVVYTVEGSNRTPQNKKIQVHTSNSETRHREEKPRIFNQPYPKLPTPYNVAKIRGSENPGTTGLPTRQRDELLSTIITGVENDDKEVANPSSPDSTPLDYYDDLYEEFMHSAYNDYYDNTPSEISQTGSSKGSFSQRKDSVEKSEKVLSSPDGRDVELVTTQVSHTRRDPPSDMYTTSRTIGRPTSLTSTERTDKQSTFRSAVEEGENTSEQRSSTVPSPTLSSSIASVDTSVEPFRSGEVINSSELDPITTSGTSLVIPTKFTTLSESPPTTTQGPTTSAAHHPYKSSAPTTTAISLSEILQNIGLSLPQFLVQLKIHKMDLKQFTSKLEKRSLTQTELKRAEGNLAMLLKILDESSDSAKIQPTPAYEPRTSERPTFKKISHDPGPRVVTEQATTLPSVSSTLPSRVSTTEEPTPSSKNLPPTSNSTTVPPKRFGFRPSTDINSNGQFVKSPNITSVDNPTNETSPSSSKENQTEEGTSEMEPLGEKSEVTHRPYRRTWGDWKERMNQNRGVNSRLGSTTRRPKFRPAYSYYGDQTELQDLIDKQNEENKKAAVESNNEEGSSASKESSIFLSKGESTVVGLTEGTPLGGSYDHPRYDRDPNSLNIATRSAIMAAGVLGGVALAVFIAIFVYVMYRNHVGKRRLRVPFPVSVSSDESVSSSPELYSTRSRLGLGGRTSNNRTDFWGTLRRKFDPYSLNSSTASYY